MKEILVSLSLVLLTSLPAGAELKKGHDWLGLQHKNFRIKTAVQYLMDGEVTGNLDRTFGSSMKNINYLLNHSSISGHRVHFINGSCIRLRRCQPHEIGAGMTSLSFSRRIERGSHKLLRPYRRAVKRYCEAFRGREVVLYGSPVLEHAMTKYALRRLIDEMLDVCPDIIPVSSPVDGRWVERYRGSLVERHMPQYWKIDGADIISTDGLNIEVVPRMVPDGVGIFLGWLPRYNLVSKEKFVPPLKRTRSPLSSHFRRVASSLQEIYKPHPTP